MRHPCLDLPKGVRVQLSGAQYFVRRGGMYQLMPSTADAVARQLGRYDLVGVPPHLMAPADQDLLAATLWDGGRGCQHWLAC